MMTTLHISYAPIIGCSPSTGWLGSNLSTLSAAQEIEASCVWHQIHRLEVCFADTLQIWCPFGALWYCASCSVRRSTELPTPLGWTRMMFLIIFEQWQEARANRMMQFKVGDFK